MTVAFINAWGILAKGVSYDGAGIFLLSLLAITVGTVKNSYF